MQDTYHGATTGELESASALDRMAAVVNQGSLFPHKGRITLSDDALILDGWKTLRPQQIRAVSHEFTDAYGRFTAGGARGGFPSFGVLKDKGAPLVLSLDDGEDLLLLVGFAPVSGTNKNAEWLPQLQQFAVKA